MPPKSVSFTFYHHATICKFLTRITPNESTGSIGLSGVIPVVELTQFRDYFQQRYITPMFDHGKYGTVYYIYRRSSEAKCGVMLYQMVFHPMSTVVEIAELRGIFLKEGRRKKPLIPYQDVMASATG